MKWLLILLVVGLGLYFLRRKPAGSAPGMADAASAYRRDNPANETGLLLMPEEVQAAVRAGDFESARLGLKKYAFEIARPGVPDDVKARFRQAMTAFAAIDPLYRQVMRRALPIIQAQPGILQSAIYPHLPEYDQETIRYVLYFAHEIGEVHRHKKGRSYELHPPGVVVEAK